MDSEVPNSTVGILLFENIENMKEIKEMLLKNKLKAAVVNTEYIYHVDQLLFAAYRTLYNARHQQLKTKSIFTELLYNLFPSRSIRDSLKTFGAQESSTSAIFVVFGSGNEISNGLKDSVKGSVSSLDRIGELRKLASIKKLYKISESIVDEQIVLNCILTKIASKELIL